MNDDETTCPQCAETIKAAAKVCKHCGCRMTAGGSAPNEAPHTEASGQSNDSSFRKRHALTGLGVVIIVIVVGATFGLKVIHDQTSRHDTSIENIAKSQITKDMLYPASAQFQEIYDYGPCVTGKVNEKNSFGAYTGFKTFYYDVKTKKGRTEPTPSAISVPGDGSFQADLAVSQAYNYDYDVCTMGAEATAVRDAEAAKMVAGWKAERNTK